MSSNAELLQRIENLSGAIRQHRIDQSTSGYNNYRGGGYRGRGGYRGSLAVRGNSWSHGRGGAIHQTMNRTAAPRSYNKTLVLNQDQSVASPSITSTPSYSAPSAVHTQPAPPASTEPKRVSIDGVTFVVKGKKLIREDRLSARPAKLPASGSHVLVSRRLIHGQQDKNKYLVAGQAPRKVVKKVKPRRSKRGNMILAREPEGYVRQGRTGKSLVLKTKRAVKRYCGLFTRYGVCPNGPRCTFLHDPSHRAICPRFLQNRCSKTASECRLSHTPSPNIMPHCVHFQRGRCTNSKCIFMHVRVRQDAAVCRAFAMEGYCSKGLECRDKHVHVCPEFAETGKCSNANCRLPHVARRTATATDKSAAGIIRPGSWMSTAYFQAQKQAQRQAVQEEAEQRQAAYKKLQQLRDQQQRSQMQRQPEAAGAKLSREEEEEQGFVRLFDDSDDDEEGWTQFASRQEDAPESEQLRFSENEEETDENESAEDSEEDSGESDYEEYEIADEEGDTVMS